MPFKKRILVILVCLWVWQMWLTILFKYFLRFDPKILAGLNRDRFVLSAGHGSMLLYSLLYLTGFKSVSLNDIKNFRQLD